MMTVSGKRGEPGLERSVAPTVCSWRTRKKRTAPRAAYTSSVIALAALNVRSPKRPSGIMGCRPRRSAFRNSTDRMRPPMPRPRGVRVAPLDQPVGDAAQGQRGQDRPDHVEAVGGLGVARLRDPALGDDHGEDGEGQVDQEDPAPVDVLDQRATDERTDRRRDAAEARPRADRLRAAVRLEGALDHRQAAGGQQRGADALEDAGDDQHQRRSARSRRAGTRPRTRWCRPRRSAAARSGRRASRRAGSARPSSAGSRWRSTAAGPGWRPGPHRWCAARR